MTTLMPDSPNAIRYLLASRQREVASLRRLLQTCELVAAISRLVHGLARERGITTLFLCSGLYDDALQQTRQDADIMQREVLRLLAGQTDDKPDAFTSRQLARVAGVLYALDTLPALRERIRRNNIARQSANAGYNAIIRSLLALVFEAADTAAEPAVSRALVAMFSFMQGKELAGQERAVGAAGFTAGTFSDEIKQTMLDLIDGQERCFDTFAEFTDESNLMAWQEARRDVDGDVERLRRFAVTGKAAMTEGGQRWFDTVTRRIDRMKSIEDGLAAALVQSAQAAIDAIEARPTDESLEMLLAQQLEQQTAYSVFVSGDDGKPLGNNNLSPQLGRSVLSLIHQQSQRLQSLSEDVTRMQASLDERRHIDEAKRLLMRHRRLTEDQAYKALRVMAMNQNKKLAEVAKAILAVQEVFDNHQ